MTGGLGWGVSSQRKKIKFVAGKIRHTFAAAVTCVCSVQRLNEHFARITLPSQIQ